LALIVTSCGTSRTKGLKLPSEDIVQKLAIPDNGGIYFGAFADFGHSEHDISVQKIRDFEKLAKKRIAWTYISNNWGEGIVYPKDDVHTIYKSGSTPFIRMMPRTNKKQVDENIETNFTLQRIIDGIFDDELRKWAMDAKEDNIPLLIDFGLEMTGYWFQWSGKYSGAGKLNGYGDPSYPDGPERFRDAYRHIIDIFREVGVKHITWFFHPDIQRWPDVWWNSAKYYYPGDDYIDWIGLSIYGVQNEKWSWITFSDTVKKWYKIHIKDIVGTKPVAVLEMGVTDGRSDGSKKEWLEDAFSTILDNPYIKFFGLTYWHENWITPSGVESRLRIDSSPESLETFQRLIRNDRFLSKTIFTQE
jgi:beta-mannanase